MNKQVLLVRTENFCTEHVRIVADDHGVELTIQDSEEGDTRTYLSWAAWEQIRAFPARLTPSDEGKADGSATESSSS